MIDHFIQEITIVGDDQDRTFPPQGTLFAINMLVNTKGGDTYTFNEIKDTLETAGFGKEAKTFFISFAEYMVSGEL